MAVNAFFCSVFVLGYEMAGFTRGDGMQANQRECRDVMVEEHFLPPTALVVAFFTSFAEFFPVNINLAVTTITRKGKFLLRDGTGMTFVALNLDVFESQWKFGLVVIISVFFPLRCLVTGFTLYSVSPFVRISNAMAAIAGEFKFLLE